MFVNTLKSKNRDSNFELLRLFSQYCIVLYHILFFFISPNNENIFFKTLQIPLHMGVIVFVLLSGYFTIKPNSKGLIKLIGIFLVYSIPDVCTKLMMSDSIKEIGHSFMILSNTQYWFVRTYLYLFLFAPVLNFIFKNASVKFNWYIVCALCFVALYMGTAGGDDSLRSGKNLVNFILIYCCGNMLSRYRDKWKQISIFPIFMFFIVLNSFMLTSYVFVPFEMGRKVLWHLFFPYTSPFLLLNAILVFCIFGKMNIKSPVVNYLAGSSFAIYLIHSNTCFFNEMRLLVENIGISLGYNQLLFFVAIVLFAFCVICVCVLIDKILSPIWFLLNKFGTMVNRKIGF
jgi:hypothetical protein